MYANLAFDDTSAWSLSPTGSVIDDTFGHRSRANALTLLAGTPITGINGQGQPIYGAPVAGYASQGEAIAAVPTFVSFWCRRLAEGATLTLRAVDDATGTVLATRLLTSAMGTGDWQPLHIAFVPLDPVHGTTITLTTEATGGQGVVGYWLIDDGWSDTRENPELVMAVMLSERVIHEVLSTLQANLAAELAKIQAARGDGLAFPAPDHWFNRQHREWASDACQCEVFEAGGGIEFTNPRADLSAGLHTSSQTVVQIAITHVNRAQFTGAQMADSARRYAVAVANVLRDHPGLYSSDPYLAFLVTGARVLPAEDYLDDKLAKVGVRMNFVLAVIQQENKVGEDIPGGAALPAYPLTVS